VVVVVVVVVVVIMATTLVLTATTITISRVKHTTFTHMSCLSVVVTIIT